MRSVFLSSMLVVFSGCSSPGNQRPDPADGWNAIVADLASGDVDRTWEAISAKSQKIFNDADHKDHPERTNGGKLVFAGVLAKKKPFVETAAKFVEIRGEVAVLSVPAKDGQPAEVWVVYEGGRWRMAYAEMEEAGKWPPQAAR